MNQYVTSLIAFAMIGTGGQAFAADISGGARGLDKIEIHTSSGRDVVVTPITPDIIKVSNLLPGESVPTTTLSRLKPQKVETATSKIGDIYSLTTSGGVSVRVNAKTGAVEISGGPNRSISDSGMRTVADGRQEMKLSTMGSGSFYGGGERGYSFNLVGDTLVMYNKQNYQYKKGETRIKQMNISMPLFLSSNGYAVVFDDHAAAKMIMSNPIEYITEGRKPVSYYFVNSTGSLADLTEKLTQLTGRQELPPMWALGYITSKYGYRTQAETVGVVDTLKRQGYPVDGIVLDLYWYGKEEDMGRLAWDPVQFPNHKKMLSDLKKRGVNTVTISQPYVLRNSRGVDNYNFLRENNLLLEDTTGKMQDISIWVGEGGMFDVSKPTTRKWLRERYKQLTLDGVGGWWGDLGEPEVHPESALHFNGERGREYHNQYGNDWSEIIYDLYKEEFPDTRLMTMMRGGTTGLQQFSVFPWSTDVSRSWGGMQPQVTIMLNSGLSGMGYMSHDVGGFAIEEDRPYDPELYVRWLQLGLFSPVLRTHSQQNAEPYKYPMHGDLLRDIVKQRYSWLPYNYTLAYENAAKGYPLVRPLNFYSEGSAKYDDIDDEYLWGRDVLVAPVMTEGARERSVVFPDGMWVDYNNPTRIYNGGDTAVVKAPLEVLPLFVRTGSFIPKADYAMENTGDYRTDRYTIDYYPYIGKSEYQMFEDDRKSTSSLKDNSFSLVTFKGDATSEGITIQVSSEGTYPGAPKSKDLTFCVHLLDTKPSVVTIDGKVVKKWKYDEKNATLTLSTKWDVAKNLEIKIS